jgi:hypothetical protein
VSGTALEVDMFARARAARASGVDGVDARAK